MDSYILRVYRRDENDPEGIIGLIMAVRTGEVMKFDGRDELWKVVCAKPKEKRRKDKRGR